LSGETVSSWPTSTRGTSSAVGIFIDTDVPSEWTSYISKNRTLSEEK
jgi:hypothetical protein